MNKFKILPGKYEAHGISRENFERYTRKGTGSTPHVQVDRDGERRCFAVCPACDNPIQIVGLYSKTELGPYGKHYCRSVPGIARHNEQAYMLCPYASRNYSPPGKESRKSEMTDYELSIYNIVRDHFDQIVYILKQETGLFIDELFARDIVRTYYAGRGWMYQWATIYNIPWMLLYLHDGFDIYGKLVRKGSDLHSYLKTDGRYSLNGSAAGDYEFVRTTRWVSSSFMAWKHRRRVEGGEVKESIALSLAENLGDGKFIDLWERELCINESRFLRLITSEKGEKYRKQSLIDIARQEMPEMSG